MRTRILALCAAILVSVGIVGVVNGSGGMNGDETAGDKPDAIVGMSEGLLRERHGDPATLESFPMSSEVREFRIELLNVIAVEDYENDTVEIRELTWTVSEAENLTVWLREKDGDWIAIASNRWHPEADF